MRLLNCLTHFDLKLQFRKWVPYFIDLTTNNGVIVTATRVVICKEAYGFVHAIYIYIHIFFLTITCKSNSKIDYIQVYGSLCVENSIEV